MDIDGRIWRLRDAAVRVAQGCGLRMIAGDRLRFVADWQGMRIAYREAPKFVPSNDLGYRLEIWSPDLVLSLQWSKGDGRRDIVSFVPGEWEKALLRLGPG